MEPNDYEVRFKFLFTLEDKRPRYVLHCPDLVELRWSVFDIVTRRTIGFGQTSEQAVDSAISRTGGVVQSTLPLGGGR